MIDGGYVTQCVDRVSGAQLFPPGEEGKVNQELSLLTSHFTECSKLNGFIIYYLTLASMCFFFPHPPLRQGCGADIHP